MTMYLAIVVDEAGASWFVFARVVVVVEAIQLVSYQRKFSRLPVVYLQVRAVDDAGGFVAAMACNSMMPVIVWNELWHVVASDE